MLWGVRCTEKADIYSYGIILWEICTGEPPERGRLRDVLVPEECPAAVRDLMLNCLDTRPSLRPSAVQIVEILNKTAAYKAQSLSTIKVLDSELAAESGSASQGLDFETQQPEVGQASNTSEADLNNKVSPFAAFAAETDVRAS